MRLFPAKKSLLEDSWNVCDIKIFQFVWFEEDELEDREVTVGHDRLIAEYDRLSTSMKETFTLLFQIDMKACYELANNSEEFSGWFSELNKVSNHEIISSVILTERAVVTENAISLSDSFVAVIEAGKILFHIFILNFSLFRGKKDN